MVVEVEVGVGVIRAPEIFVGAGRGKECVG